MAFVVSGSSGGRVAVYIVVATECSMSFKLGSIIAFLCVVLDVDVDVDVVLDVVLDVDVDKLEMLFLARGPRNANAVGS